MSAATAPELLAGVIGWPVLHSLSPRIHLAAAEAVGVAMSYEAIEIRPGEAAGFVSSMAERGVRGYSVTMPHKEAVIAAVDELTDTAQTLGAVNHITNFDGHVVGNNTDGDGFVLGLEHEAQISVSGRSVGVIGSGGAARAIIDAVHRHGAASVSVLARNPERAARAAGLAGDVGQVCEISELAECDVLVNTTPMGMEQTPGEGQLAYDVSQLMSTTVVVDIVYKPLETPLLAAAREHGLVTVDGLAMLVGQAAAQFTTWTGIEAPLSAMFAAVRH